MVSGDIANNKTKASACIIKGNDGQGNTVFKKPTSLFVNPDGSSR
jgi:hypothetical protein